MTNARRAARVPMSFAVVLAVAACASDSAARKPAKPKVAAPVVAPAAPPEPEPPPPPPTSSVRIKGLTGTLNKDDVHQTMEARQPELDACILESRRRIRLVSGKIQFSFKVDAEGRVEDVHATESNIGHYPLESCILRVLTETVFPKPDGSASARFEWGLSVDPATARSPEPLDPEVLDKVLDKHADEIREECETLRRERFTVTAYLNRKGRVITAGALPEPASAGEKVECVLEGLKKLRMPKQKRETKVTFLLR